MDIFDGIIIGVAGSVIGGVILYKVLQLGPPGGDTPTQPAIPRSNQFGYPQPLYVVDLPPTPDSAAPVQQTNPNTEAAYSVNGVAGYEPVGFSPGFGPYVLEPNNPAILPQ